VSRDAEAEVEGRPIRQSADLADGDDRWTRAVEILLAAAAEPAERPQDDADVSRATQRGDAGETTMPEPARRRRPKGRPTQRYRPNVKLAGRLRAPGQPSSVDKATPPGPTNPSGAERGIQTLAHDSEASHGTDSRQRQQQQQRQVPQVG
jgi:hypothetical protein